MKKIIVSSLLVLMMSVSLFAQAISKQEASDSLPLAIDKFVDATLAYNVDEILGATYSKVFEIVPREQMSAALKAAINNEAFPKIKEMKVPKIGPVNAFSGGFYVVLDSSAKMQMNGNPSGDEANKAIQELLENQGMTVDFDKEKQLFNMSKEGKIVAINEGVGWTFVDYEQALSLNALPEDITSKIKK